VAGQGNNMTGRKGQGITEGQEEWTNMGC